MNELMECVCDRVVGRKKEILMILSALHAGKHIFLEGPPGTSKSTILQAISECTRIGYSLITGNSDLSTSKLVGYFDPAETLSRGYRPECFVPGPLTESMQKGLFLYIEEFNRLPDETTNVFVTVMSEKRLSVPRFGMVEAHRDFRIIAALNPLDDIGISRISRALKDRFTSIRLDYQSREEERAIVRRRSVRDTDGIIDLAVDIARETRRHPDIKLGSSVRGGIDMVDIYRRALELVPPGNGDTEEILLRSALMAFRNRIWIYETTERQAEDILTEIFERLHRVKKKPS